jgi:protein-disulfide isomerase
MLEPEYESAMLSVPVNNNDHHLGDLNAPLVIVEYGDFECPFCRAAYYKTKPLEPLYGEQLAFVFREFPLVQVHPHSEDAAEAAEIAGSRGKFWGMHHRLFENQEALDRESLVGYAVQPGLDPAWFEEQLEHHTQEMRVRADFMSGVRSGVNGTPTFFVNGMRLGGGTDELLAIVARAV